MTATTSRATEPESETTLELVTFRVGEETYGLDLAAVWDVLDGSGVQPEAALPGALCGHMRVRSLPLPVLDLRRRLGLLPREVGGGRVLVSPAARAQGLGLLVDEVHGVERVDRRALAPLPRYFDRSGEVVLGLVRLEDGLAIVLAAERLISPWEREALERWGERENSA